MNFGARHVYMEGTPGAVGGGDPGAAAAAGAGGTPASQPGATPSGSTPAGAGGDPASSALSTGSEWTPESIPEKYRVKNDAGEFDAAASLRKVDEARAALEKRMGSGDIRPKTPDEYKLPDTDVFKNLKLDDAGAKAFRQEAHDMGLSQKQYEAIMGKWASLAPELVNAGQVETAETAIAALKDAWKDQYDANIKESFRVVTQVAEKAGISFEEAEKAIGNNATALRLFAALGAEMQEDRTPAAANGGTGGGAQTREQYVAENWKAYSDPTDPKHKAVTERANALAARESKGRADPL